MKARRWLMWDCNMKIISIILLFSFLFNFYSISYGEYCVNIHTDSSIYPDKIFAGDYLNLKVTLFDDQTMLKDHNILCYLILPNGFILSDNNIYIPPDKDGRYKYSYINTSPTLNNINNDLYILFYKNNIYLTGFILKVKTLEGYKEFSIYKSLEVTGALSLLIYIPLYLLSGIGGVHGYTIEGINNVLNYLLFYGLFAGIGGVAAHFYRIGFYPDSFEKDSEGRIIVHRTTFEAELK